MSNPKHLKLVYSRPKYELPKRPNAKARLLLAAVMDKIYESHVKSLRIHVDSMTHMYWCLAPWPQTQDNVWTHLALNTYALEFIEDQ